MSDIFELKKEINIGDISTRTLCDDIKTCKDLNEFLNDKEKLNSPFTIDFTGESIRFSIDTKNMTKWEVVKLNQRVMNFMMRELEIIANGD